MMLVDEAQAPAVASPSYTYFTNMFICILMKCVNDVNYFPSHDKYAMQIQ